MIWWYLLFWLIHMVCCILILIGIRGKVLKVHGYMFYVALFLPFWGPLIILLIHFRLGFKKDSYAEVGVEKMKLDSELYKGVAVDNSKIAGAIIPMEEALIINNARERRNLIMDVLNDNPKEYIEFLQKAGNNDDTEVVHYAVTAMVEISTENDYKLQQLERAYSQNPDDYEVIGEYADFLWNCLEQNLMQGQVEVMNRNTFDELIKKKIQHSAQLLDYVRMAKNCLKLKEYTEAGETIDIAERLWPQSEEVILLKIEYLTLLKQGDKLKEYLRHLEKQQIYLSARTKEAIAFWKN